MTMTTTAEAAPTIIDRARILDNEIAFQEECLTTLQATAATVQHELATARGALANGDTKALSQVSKFSTQAEGLGEAIATATAKRDAARADLAQLQAEQERARQVDRLAEIAAQVLEHDAARRQGIIDAAQALHRALNAIEASRVAGAQSRRALLDQFEMMVPGVRHLRIERAHQPEAAALKGGALSTLLNELEARGMGVRGVGVNDYQLLVTSDTEAWVGSYFPRLESQDKYVQAIYDAHMKIGAGGKK